MAALALAGCENSGEPTQPQVLPSATSGGTVGTAVVDCGSERIGPSGLAAGEARRCFIEAVAAGRAATLQSTVLSTEGDPVVYSLTSDTRRGITVVEDRGEDRFRGAGPARWRFVCTSIDSAEETRPGHADLVVNRLRGCTSPEPV
ncbi:hypothetical protein ACG83_06330 [Frankia sp. R43]|uniref:DUF4362 domain-containing protein n=1 Tax=Frankia sp. R43 TaxID=269536 RepID=UPI0006CA39A4|nr:DUF4362 domain-containing protein [Frankia sp. R43]KPM57332.1 hypothetical protein ACG83_06330 [Frankia sp. R43]